MYNYEFRAHPDSLPYFQLPENSEVALFSEYGAEALASNPNCSGCGWSKCSWLLIREKAPLAIVEVTCVTSCRFKPHTGTGDLIRCLSSRPTFSVGFSTQDEVYSNPSKAPMNSALLNCANYVQPVGQLLWSIIQMASHTPRPPSTI